MRDHRACRQPVHVPVCVASNLRMSWAPAILVQGQVFGRIRQAYGRQSVATRSPE